MLEYYNENIWYKKKSVKKGKKFKKFLIFMLFFAIFTLFILHIKFNVCKNTINYIEEYSKAKCSNIINNSIKFSLNDSVSYSDLVVIEKNSLDEITLISANTHKINKLSQDTVNLIKINAEKEFNKGIEIPIMTFSGIKMFSGYGKKIIFKAVNITSVKCQFYSSFLSAGINQTLHKITVNIECELNANMFFEQNKIVLNQDVLISETVLVGKIPNLYLNNGVFKWFNKVIIVDRKVFLIYNY